MGAFKILYDELIGFFGISPLIDMYKSGNYSSLHTFNGIISAIGPFIPLLLIIEITSGAIHKRAKIIDYKIPLITYVFNRFISRFISITAVVFCIGVFQKYAVLKTSFTWYWIIYSYIIWEFAHFIYHYLGHKVRLFWCLHSTHHAPTSMNLSVTYVHFFLETPYANIIRTSICIIMGVSPPVLFFIMFIDSIWGAFIHINENMGKHIHLGFIEKIILMPAHHRVHHGKNPLYMDTNFCSLLNIWDRVFGTFQAEKNGEPPVYGITREINPNNFFDAYFGEIPLLYKDVKNAPGIKNKFLYIIMPPGWSHTGNHNTATVIREEFIKNTSGESFS